jgi:PBP1b-binding outer membrane lipoprotein LpoB
MRLALLLACFLLFTGCSEEKASEASEKDHVMRSQIDAMNQAKEVRSLVQERLDEEQKQSEEITK